MTAKNKMKKVVYAELYPGTVGKWFVLLECGHFGTKQIPGGKTPQRSNCFECDESLKGGHTVRELFDSHQTLAGLRYALKRGIEEHEFAYPDMYSLTRTWL